MKTPIRFAVFLSAFFFASTLSIFAQGSITPTGTPGATMKSLDQIEPRTPISSLPFTISTGGGYYLTKNLNIASGDAITIVVSGVTLDLNGFEITSTESSPAHSGILINSGTRNIRIMNGQIRGNVTLSGSTFSGSGFANGIQINGTQPVNVHVSDVSVAGCLSAGINLGSSGLVESCNVSVIGGTGITADTVIYSNAYNFGSVGIQAIANVTGCHATTTTSNSFYAIHADDTVIGCVASSNASSTQGVIECQIARDCWAAATGAGDAVQASTAENCNGFASGTGSGIHCFQSAINCYGTSGGGSKSGVDVIGGTALNCYGTAGGSGNGLSALSAEHCYGRAFGTGSTGGSGVLATVAENCYGEAAGNNGAGIDGTNAENCYGKNLIGVGVKLLGPATNCTGAGAGAGVEVDIANTCRGTSTGSGHGVIASRIANTCWGTNSSGSATGGGVVAEIAANCFGDSGGSGDGVLADTLAIGCTGTTSFGQVVNSPNKYNEPQ